MFRFVARILLLRLIVAVPLQGVTAATLMTKAALSAERADDGHDMGTSLSTASNDDDDHCLAHSGAEPVKSSGNSMKHAGHACPGCVACSLCSVVPFSFPLSIHLDDSVAQASFSLSDRFVSHISDTLQRPPAVRV